MSTLATNIRPCQIGWTFGNENLFHTSWRVKASEVVQSDFYQTGYTLRFPRIEKVRYDKPWKDCLTTDEFTKLRLAASGSLVGSYITAQPPRAKKRRAAQPQPSVSAQFRATHLDHVKAHSQLFTGKEICILTGLHEVSKQDLERQVKENGGKIVLNPGLCSGPLGDPLFL
ncbi:DNA ligase (ATP) [Homalodisca vitripennis]|nr:DNA ligase (ATP) [Homalodisca vitripennis]